MIIHNHLTINRCLKKKKGRREQAVDKSSVYVELESMSLALLARLIRQSASLASVSSIVINVNHAEGGGLIWLALVLNSEDHHFVVGEAVGLLFGHLQDQRDQLVHVLLWTREKRKDKGLAIVRTNASESYEQSDETDDLRR